MNNFLLKNEIKKIAIIVSKPLDIYNAYLFINQMRAKDISLTIHAMEGDINNLIKESVNKFFPKADLTFFRAGDFYSLFIKNLILKFDNNKKLNKKLKKFLILNIKTFAFLFSKFYWLPFFIKNLLKNRINFFDLIITDPWASKIFYLSTLNSKYLIFQDGGSSTETFKLLDPLFFNSSKDYYVFDIVIKSLNLQKVKIPFYLKNYILNKIAKIDKNKIFFATKCFYLKKSYSRSKNKEAFKKILGRKGNSIITINELKNNNINLIKNELFIILGKDDDGFYSKAIKKIFLKTNFKKIYLRPHPMGNTDKYKYPLLNQELTKYSDNVYFLEPKSSFEEYYSFILHRKWFRNNIFLILFIKQVSMFHFSPNLLIRWERHSKFT